MNFYFLCLVSFVTILATRETLGLSDRTTVVFIIMLFLAIIMYQTKFENFISVATRSKIMRNLKLYKIQKQDVEKTNKELGELHSKLK